MLGLGNSHVYSMANQSTVSNISRDEKYDYEDEISDENDESGISLSKVRVENGFSFRSFIDQINAKTKALAMARELDAKRGIVHQDATASAGSIDSATSASSDLPKISEKSAPRTSIRRIPSGARASTAQPDLSATPMKDVSQNENSHAQTINDLLVQSTPINTSKSAPSSRNTQPRDLLREKFMENHRPQADLEKSISEFPQEKGPDSGLKKTAHIEFEGADVKSAGSKLSMTELNEKDQMIDELRAIVKDQDLRSTELLERIETLQDQVSMQETLAKTIQDQRSQEQEELKRSNNQILSKDQELDQIREHVKLLSENFESSNNEREREAADLRFELDNFKASAQELTGRISTLEQEKVELVGELRLCSIKCADLQSASKTVQEKSERERQEHFSESRDSENMIVSLEASIRDLRSELEKEKEASSIKKASSEDELGRLRGQNEDLQRDLEKLTSQIKEQTAHHKREIIEVEKSLNGARQETEKAKRRHEMLEKQHTELQGLRESLETTNAELKNVVKRLEQLSSEQIQTIGKLEEEAERKMKKEANALSNAKKHSKQLEEKVRQLQDVVITKKNELESAKKDNTTYASYVGKVKLFETQIGDLINEQYTTDMFCSHLDAQLKVRCPGTIGFLTESEKESSSVTLASLQAAKSDVDMLQRAIRNDWTVKVNKLENELANKTKELPPLRELIQDLEHRAQGQEARIAKLEAEKQSLLKDKENDLETCQSLGNEISVLKSQLVENQSKSFVELCNKIEGLSEERHQLQSRLQTLETNLENKDVSAAQVSKLLSQEREKQAVSQEELLQLKQELQKIQGDSAHAITFQVASQARPHLNRKFYDSLMVDAVNDMDLIDLQNVVKNLILLLEIPLSKITKKMPLVAIYLRYEKSICLHFANKLHHLMFGETIDIKRFTNIVYGQYIEHHDISQLGHPLEACLDNLYKAISVKIVASQ
ncbi:LAFA_0E04104g1_1 [Lachancea sp. 'fantastica']|nr:LAFA_0E04104g1_1 [Lachancea sp. 'fantastica']